MFPVFSRLEMFLLFGMPFLFNNVLIAPAGPLNYARVKWNATFRSEIELARDPRVFQLYVPDHLPLADGRHLIFLRRRDFVIPNRG